MYQVGGYIAEIRSEVRECLGCGSLVVGGSSWCMNCVRSIEGPRKIFGVTAIGWVIIFGINLICAAAAMAIALLA